MTPIRRPVEPPPCRWQLPAAETADEHGFVAVGADLEPGTLLAAYGSGLFPMPVHRRRLGWWSPDPRGVMPLDGVHVSRSLRKAMDNFEVRHDSAFAEVMRRCGDPARLHGWIDERFISAYTRLHEMGWAHSIETWRDGRLVGGLYGVRIERFFAGESMFHDPSPAGTNASKVALVSTVSWLVDTGAELFDVQWSTPHLVSMGVVDIPRAEYLVRLRRATQPTP